MASLGFAFGRCDALGWLTACGTAGAPGTRVSAIPGALFDPSSADKIARRGSSYFAWVLLQDEHVGDLAVWPSESAAVRAVELYRAGGPDTRPEEPNPAWPKVLRRVDRIRNVTFAWYSRPTSADEAAVRNALYFGGGKPRAGVAALNATISNVPQGVVFDRSWVDPIAARGGYSVTIVMALRRALDVGIWSSPSAAKQAARQYLAEGQKTHLRSVDDQLNALLVRRVDRIRTVTLAWYYRPTVADEEIVRGALHFRSDRSGGHEFTGIWTIPEAEISQITSASVGPAVYSADLVLDCVVAPCYGPRQFEVAIWPSESDAKNYLKQYEDVSSPGELERIRNATIDWRFHQTSADEKLIRDALH